MKKVLLLLVFHFLFVQSFAQNMSKRNQLAKEFLTLIDVQKFIDNKLAEFENNSVAQIPALFKQNKLNINAVEDIAYFKTNLHQQLAFINKNIYNRLLFVYKTFDYKKLKTIVRQIRSRQKSNVPAEKKHALETAKSLIDDEIKELKQFNIPSYLDHIYAKQKPVKLNISTKNLASKQRIDDVYIIIAGYNPEKISLLNKNDYTLSKPVNYDDISGIVIVYNNIEFLFKPNPDIFKLPKKLSDLKNPVSKYSFNEIPAWEIYIDEDTQQISITLVNVEEYTTIVSKNSQILLADKTQKIQTNTISK